MAQQVRRAIYLTLPSGGATSKTVAQGLGLSTRTLQRELMAEATTFSDLLEDIRANLARRYVADPRYRIAQIAEMLGYGSHSTFPRWFTSTFGAPPHVWRARAAGAQPAAISAPSACVITSPTNFVGLSKAGSWASTSVWLMMLATWRAGSSFCSACRIQ